MRSFTGHGPAFDAVPAAVDDQEGTTPSAGQDGPVLHLRRVLRSVRDGPSALPEGATGHIRGPWHTPAGTRTGGLFAVLYANPPA